MSAFGGKADMNGSGFAVIQDREELEPAKRQRTGINLLIVEMESKRIELIRQLARRIVFSPSL